MQKHTERKQYLFYLHDMKQTSTSLSRILGIPKNYAKYYNILTL